MTRAVSRRVDADADAGADIGEAAHADTAPGEGAEGAEVGAVTSGHPGVRLAHVFSSDMGVAGALPHILPFVDAGWSVFAICPDGPRLDAIRARGVRWLPVDLSRSRAAPADALGAAAQIAAHCRRHRFDIVHTHNVKAGMVGRVAARAAGVPAIVHTVHGLLFGLDSAGGERSRRRSEPAESNTIDSPPLRRRAHAVLERAAARCADLVLVQSRDDHRALLRCGVGAGKLRVIGNGVALDRFDPARVSGAAVRAALGLTGRDVLFVSAGRLVRAKGFVELAEATARARAVNGRVHTAIVGPRDPAKADALTARELADAERSGARLLGERDDVPAIVAAADVVALASHREGLPRFLIEGAAMGRPLLATACRGSPEVVAAPAGGVLVPVSDPEALARAMVELARDPDRRAAAGAHNRRRALAVYDIRTVVDRVAAAYASVLGASPRAAAAGAAARPGDRDRRKSRPAPRSRRRWR